jgi:hypothetical protein
MYRGLSECLTIVFVLNFHNMSSLDAPNSNRKGSITLLFFDNGTWFPTGEAFGKKKLVQPQLHMIQGCSFICSVKSIFCGSQCSHLLHIPCPFIVFGYIKLYRIASSNGYLSVD